MRSWPHALRRGPGQVQRERAGAAGRRCGVSLNLHRDALQRTGCANGSDQCGGSPGFWQPAIRLAHRMREWVRSVWRQSRVLATRDQVGTPDARMGPIGVEAVQGSGNPRSGWHTGCANGSDRCGGSPGFWQPAIRLAHRMREWVRSVWRQSRVLATRDQVGTPDARIGPIGVEAVQGSGNPRSGWHTGCANRPDRCGASSRFWQPAIRLAHRMREWARSVRSQFTVPATRDQVGTPDARIGPIGAEPVHGSGNPRSGWHTGCANGPHRCGASSRSRQPAIRLAHRMRE
ncbi:hypothetical protein SAMN05421854_11751 [Amycolatopsis rubida]|uniref:Uncharacterized protein n=1 Tax=Amycolatopsis rubida TaxID=112413 RepID=A0A1I6A2P9_9PSEU|nr:hypothetical protein SAMN05421854_11751 [Amycolatopsis rubida]